MERQKKFEIIEKITKIPMLILALSMIPVLLIPMIFEISPSIASLLLIADIIIWVAFALEYVVKFSLAPDRINYFRNNIPDLLIVILPFLRPLRIFRAGRLLNLLRLTRLSAFFMESSQSLKSLLQRHQLQYVLLITVILIFIAAGMVVEFEKTHPERMITSISEGLWWSVTTITTVGYGDSYPMTIGGKIVASFLMLVGIVFFGLLTANIAAFFIHEEQVQSPEIQELKEQLSRIEEMLVKQKTLERSFESS